jgi:hypothetical protein
MKVIACIEDPAVMPKALAVLAGQALKQILDPRSPEAQSRNQRVQGVTRKPGDTG